MPTTEPAEGWPPQERAFASEIRLVQQQIQRLVDDVDELAELSRQLRRAISTGRSDVARGRLELERLKARIARRSGPESP